MSIARAGRQVLKVRRTLMFSAAVHLLQIKDLKDLSVFRSARFYRHAGPKEPEEMFFTGVIAGDRPPRYGEKMACVTVGLGSSRVSLAIASQAL